MSFNTPGNPGQVYCWPTVPVSCLPGLVQNSRNYVLFTACFTERTYTSEPNDVTSRSGPLSFIDGMYFNTLYKTLAQRRLYVSDVVSTLDQRHAMTLYKVLGHTNGLCLLTFINMINEKFRSC